MKPLNQRLPDWAIQHVREWLQEYVDDPNTRNYTPKKLIEELEQ